MRQMKKDAEPCLQGQYATFSFIEEELESDFLVREIGWDDIDPTEILGQK